MKKLFFFLVSMVAIHANATILVVKEYGVNATYSSINAALAAAQNNDTIVVYDKPSGQAWIESLTIDKNLTFLHPTEGTRFKAPGQITVVPKAGMDLYFIGWDLNGNSITATATNATATSSNRAKITVTDCINVANIDLNVDWIDARIFYNQTNISGNINFRHGLCVANICTGIINVIQESTTASQNDSIIVIGNKPARIQVDTKEAFVVANNFCTRSNGETIHGILLYERNNNKPSFCGNNTIYSNYGLLSRAYNNLKIVNNIIHNISPNYGSIWNDGGGNGLAPFISYNLCRYASAFDVNNELNYFNVSTTVISSYDTWGRATSGNTSAINMGNYLGEYYDIDLTRNDIGTYGGPYSIDNYISSGTGKGKVLYINIKHQLTNLNQILDVKASGGSKF